MNSFTSFLKDLLNYKHKAGSDGLDISSLLNNHVVNCFAKLSSGFQSAMACEHVSA